MILASIGSGCYHITVWVSCTVSSSTSFFFSCMQLHSNKGGFISTFITDLAISANGWMLHTLAFLIWVLTLRVSQLTSESSSSPPHCLWRRKPAPRTRCTAARRSFGPGCCSCRPSCASSPSGCRSCSCSLSRWQPGWWDASSSCCWSCGPAATPSPHGTRPRRWDRYMTCPRTKKVSRMPA